MSIRSSSSRELRQILGMSLKVIIRFIHEERSINYVFAKISKIPLKT